MNRDKIGTQTCYVYTGVVINLDRSGYVSLKLDKEMVELSM